MLLANWPSTHKFRSDVRERTSTDQFNRSHLPRQFRELLAPHLTRRHPRRRLIGADKHQLHYSKGAVVLRITYECILPAEPAIKHSALSVFTGKRDVRHAWYCFDSIPFEGTIAYDIESPFGLASASASVCSCGAVPEPNLTSPSLNLKRQLHEVVQCDSETIRSNEGVASG